MAGLENIPKDTPILFAPNHQNALMDALAVLFAANKTVGFLARADIFKKPRVAKILNFIKIMPVYRIRDGYENLENNKEVFQNTVDVLKANIPICILPEGNHLGEKRLRPLKKGIGRIAFQAENEESFKLGLQVIPVGIDYSNYYNAGTDLLVQFGKPILIKDYEQAWTENRVKALNAFINHLSEEMKALMIHIPELHYNTIMQACSMFEPNVWNTLNLKRHLYNKLVIKQYIVQKSQEVLKENVSIFDQLSTMMNAYNEKLHSYKLVDKLMQYKHVKILPLLIETLVTILLLPIHLIGMVSFYLPYKLAFIAAKNIKDPIFKGSIRFGVALLLYPIYYIILLAILYWLTPLYEYGILVAIILPFVGYFTFYNYKNMIKLRGKIRLFLLKTRNKKAYTILKEERNEIIQIIETITKH